MRLFSYSSLVWGMALFTVLVVGFTADNVGATPFPNSATINERIFNDCPTSVLTTTNNYPSLIAIQDEVLDCGGFANLHNWRFSEDGATDAVFSNGDAYSFCAVLTITGTGEGEAGLQVAPWWSQDVDGRFNVRTTDGEIACFGGRLPFFSFTATFGVTYTKGDAIFLRILYLPNELSETNPATIEYELIYGSWGSLSSGPLPFDQGNPAEDPPYGLWGMLNDGRVGGYMQAFLQAGNPDAGLRAEWTQICFDNLDTVPTEAATWGQVKTLYK
jgi:hypothetical protein